MIVYLNLFSWFKICPRNLYSGEFFTRVVHLWAFVPSNQPENPLFFHLYISHDHSVFFVFLSQKHINMFAMSSFCFSLAFILSVCSAHWTGAISSLSRFFRPSLELAFVGDSAFPSHICNSSTLAAGYMCPATMLFVIQIMLIVKIQSVSSVQDLFLRQFFGVRHSICQCLLAAHIHLVFSVPSCRCYNVILQVVYVFPPSVLIPYISLTEFF